MSEGAGGAVDLRRVMAEIDEEVRRKRATGELTPEFERELDLVFARYAPVGAVSGDFHQVLAKVEQAVLIDTLAPTDSSRPVVPWVKKAVAKAIGWNVRHVASQVSGLATAMARALRLLGERVDALEAMAPGPVPEGRRAATAGRLTSWHPLVTAALAGAAGRVLHAECGSGDLLRELVGSGLDAYGVEPDDDLALVAAARSLDVRADTTAGHLRLLERGSLHGLVLSGCVDHLPLGHQLELVDLATAKLAAGGRFVLVGSDPSAWGWGRSPVEADLSPGRPLHPETWATLLQARGFADLAIHPGPVERALGPVPGAGEAAEALNADLALLNEVLFRPRTYAVTATRSPA